MARTGKMPAEAGSQYGGLALDALRGAGLRVTRPRRSVVELLERSNRPLTAAAIHEALSRRRIAIDLASVYRTLAVLEAQGLIHRLATVEGVVRCEPGVERGTCHHHAICRDCGGVREFSCEEGSPVATELERRTGYALDRHAVEITGVCPECRARA